LKQELLELELKEIYVPTDRLREDYGDPGLSQMLSEQDNGDDEEDDEGSGGLGRSRSRRLAKSMGTYGQILPIRVAKLDRRKWPGSKPQHKWLLIDGGRRYRAAFLLHALDQTIPNVTAGSILAVTNWTDEDINLRMQEFYANENRMDFSWFEKMRFYREIHDAFVKEHGKGWTAKQTAMELHIGDTTLTKYLKLSTRKHKRHLADVKGHKSFNAAYEHFERAVRRARDARSSTKDVGSLVDKKEAPPGTAPATSTARPQDVKTIDDVALNIVKKGDCRKWITEFQAGTFSWCHWDPPYGGEEEGGAFSSHERIDDTPGYSRLLMEDMIPEIFRVLKPGGWIAIWYHPQYYQWLRDLLSGHEKRTVFTKDKSGVWYECKHCKSPWDDRKEVCWKNPNFKFWVNMYPCVWYKVGHKDGHSIKRHLTKQTEYFLLAAKVTLDDPKPPLPVSNRSNVFEAEVPRGENRRHVMHKPQDLLRDVIGVISNEGTIGFDPSVGSGSSIEAALYTGRRIVSCELSQEYWLGAVETTKKILFNLASGIDPSCVKEEVEEGE